MRRIGIGDGYRRGLNCWRDRVGSRHRDLASLRSGLEVLYRIEAVRRSQLVLAWCMN